MVKHAERAAGESKYSVWKLIALQYDLLTGTSTFPLRMLTFLGFLIAFLGVLFGVFVFVMTRFKGDDWGQHGIFTLFAILFIFIGAQFAGMGLLGEYIGKIYLETKARPRYIISDRTEDHTADPE